MFIGGINGMFLDLILAFVLNFETYWWSDKIVLKIYKAKPIKGEMGTQDNCTLMRGTQCEDCPASKAELPLMGGSVF